MAPKKPRYFIEYMVTHRKGLRGSSVPFSRLSVSTCDPWIVRSRSRVRRVTETAAAVIRPTGAQAATAVRELLDIPKEEWREMVDLYRAREKKVKAEHQQLRKRRVKRLLSKVRTNYKAEYLRIAGKKVRVSVMGKDAVKALESIKKSLGVKGIPTKKSRKLRAIRGL